MKLGRVLDQTIQLLVVLQLVSGGLEVSKLLSGETFGKVAPVLSAEVVVKCWSGELAIEILMVVLEELGGSLSNEVVLVDLGVGGRH